MENFSVRKNHSPIAGSKTACAACSSLTGVLSHIFLSFNATGESESSACATVDENEKFRNCNFQLKFTPNLL